MDQGIALYFPAPHSFTGEDVRELQAHGGPAVLDLLLRRTLELGARLARAGEFTERAFLNDKLDLAQAEAVAGLIEATSAQAARAAVRSLQGELSRRVEALVEEVTELRVYVEAAIDFPEEELDALADGQVAARLEALIRAAAALLAEAEQGRLLSEGLHLVIAGQPNAGKSSLLNRLAARESAIVTELPGTTRDLLRERILLDGIPVHVTDTAGLRESADPVEREGIRRAWAAMEEADRVLLVVDDRSGPGDEDRAIAARLPAGLPVTVVRNKADLSGRGAAVGRGELGPEVSISALTGAGIEVLREHLKQAAGYHPGAEAGFLARRRHLDAIERALADMRRGHDQLVRQRAGDLLAEDLRQAQEALGEVTGRLTSDDLLGRIFASFCIGK
jgi:tRNA modification GTPase